MQIQIGSKVHCQWGAMFPTEERTVIKLENDRLWTEEGFTMLLSDLRDFDKEYRSPVGVWLIK
jgi:hypothetical protein|tara:strand:+ start:266 stop:454 length:189 start_codon:yes stop_codon:yes gene_type:complete